MRAFRSLTAGAAAVAALALSASLSLSACGGSGGSGGSAAPSSRVPCEDAPSQRVDVPWLPSALSLPSGSRAFAQSTSETERTADFVVKGSLHDVIAFIEREWGKAGMRVRVPDVEATEAELVASGTYDVFVGLRQRYCDKDRLFARIALHAASATRP